MTDNEIIKALERCIEAKSLGGCKELGCPALTQQGCYYYLRTDEDSEGAIYVELIKNALDLINRQKAEIESTQKLLQATIDCSLAREKFFQYIKAEAVKEFACELERSLINMPQKDINYSNLVEHIENLVKERVGDAK